MTDSSARIELQACSCATDNEGVWAEALPKLTRYVRRQVPSNEDACDIAQETAARAIREGVTFVDADDLLRWCQVVAKRLAIDHRRRAAQNGHTTLEAEMPDSADLTDQVHARLHLLKTFQAVDHLPPSERLAMVEIIAGTDLVGDRRQQLRTASARRRARVSLQRQIGYPWAVTGIVVLSKKVWRAASRGAPAAPALLVAYFAIVPFIGGTHTMDPITRTPRHGPVDAHSGGVTIAHIQRSSETKSTPSVTRLHPQITRTPPPGQVISSVQGPANTSSTLESQPNHPGNHLLCTDGTLIPGPVCIG